MHQSLMFVFYPGKTPGSTVFGARSTKYHDPPSHTADIPDVRVVSTRSENGYSILNFICYACNRWGGTRLDADAVSQPWIWATNPFQDANLDDPYKPLQIHTYYDYFYMNMKSGQVVDPVEPYFPTISTDRTSIAAGHTRDAAGGVAASKIWLYHGILMAFAFGVLYPLGVASLVVSVKYHWIVQSITAGCGILGIGVAVFATKSISSFLGLHQGLGCLAGLLFVVQYGLGFRHHVLFVRAKRQSVNMPPPQTGLKQYHIWTGRGLYFLGVSNVALGLLLAQKHRALVIPWLITVGLELAGYYYVLVRRKRQMPVEPLSKGSYAYDPVNDSEEAMPLNER
ncbi:hypothetical protein VTN96DRAFT_2738 [Rasamsonia emersonii]